MRCCHFLFNYESCPFLDSAKQMHQVNTDLSQTFLSFGAETGVVFDRNRDVCDRMTGGTVDVCTTHIVYKYGIFTYV